MINLLQEEMETSLLHKNWQQRSKREERGRNRNTSIHNSDRRQDSSYRKKDNRMKGFVSFSKEERRTKRTVKMNK
jgi:hypothetical protein